MKCKHIDDNMKYCNCSYTPCSKKGTCCECLHYHLSMGEFPGCFFTDKWERTWDRSVDAFKRMIEEEGLELNL